MPRMRHSLPRPHPWTRAFGQCGGPHKRLQGERLNPRENTPSESRGIRGAALAVPVLVFLFYPLHRFTPFRSRFRRAAWSLASPA